MWITAPSSRCRRAPRRSSLADHSPGCACSRRWPARPGSSSPACWRGRSAADAPAQALAMLGVLLAPQYLGIDSFLSMNSFESAFWMLCLLALILILRGGSDRLWLLFGAAAGLGLLNKPSMTFFLVALLLALLVTPQRRLLRSRWAARGRRAAAPHHAAQPAVADPQPLADARVPAQRRSRQQVHPARADRLPRHSRSSV